MIRILVDHHLIAVPVPACDDVVIVGRYVPINVPEPEAFAVSSAQHEDVLRAEAAAEASVRPGLIDMVMRIAGARIVAHPLIVVGVHVRKFRMTSLISGNAVLGRGLLNASRYRCRGWRECPSGRGTVSGNVPAADRCGMTAAVRLPAVLPILRGACHAYQNQKSNHLLHTNSPWRRFRTWWTQHVILRCLDTDWPVACTLPE